MTAVSGCRALLVAGLATLLCIAGPGWPVTAEPVGRPPGVPPPVNPAALPSPAIVSALPYIVNNRATRQTGPVEQQAVCQQPGSARNAEAEPAAQQRLRIRQAQQFAIGHGQRVAVIDSGVHPHPRLGGRLLDGGDYIDNRSGLFDCDGHGTAVAGLIAAAPDPTTRFVGVAPAAEILAIRQASTFYSVPLRQLDTGHEVHSPITGDTVSMAAAVVRAVQLGATVINISEAACFPAERDQVNAPYLQAAVHYAVEHNVVVVVAAANTGSTCRQNSPGMVTTISSPGWFDDDVLTVAATDGNGDAADFSIRGPWVDVAAPGTGAVSLAAAGPGSITELVDAHGTARPLDGTSFATPYVAGLAALVRDRFTHLTARQVMRRIERTSQHTAGPGGRSEELGYGMVDPVAALTAVLPEEQSSGSAPLNPALLSGLQPPPTDNSLPRTVALAGSATALTLLALTLLITHTLKRRSHDRIQRAQRG